MDGVEEGGGEGNMPGYVICHLCKLLSHLVVAISGENIDVGSKSPDCKVEGIYVEGGRPLWVVVWVSRSTARSVEVLDTKHGCSDV